MIWWRYIVIDESFNAITFITFYFVEPLKIGM